MGDIDDFGDFYQLYDFFVEGWWGRDTGATGFCKYTSDVVREHSLCGLGVPPTGSPAF